LIISTFLTKMKFKARLSHIDVNEHNDSVTLIEFYLDDNIQKKISGSKLLKRFKEQDIVEVYVRKIR
jgi:hypothetical protein